MWKCGSSSIQPPVWKDATLQQIGHNFFSLKRSLLYFLRCGPEGGANMFRSEYIALREAKCSLYIGVCPIFLGKDSLLWIDLEEHHNSPPKSTTIVELWCIEHKKVAPGKKYAIHQQQSGQTFFRLKGSSYVLSSRPVGCKHWGNIAVYMRCPVLWNIHLGCKLRFDRTILVYIPWCNISKVN